MQTEKQMRPVFRHYEHASRNKVRSAVRQALKLGQIKQHEVNGIRNLIDQVTGFSICKIYCGENRVPAIGYAFCWGPDRFDHKKARRVSLGRAYNQLDSLEKNGQ